MSEIELICQFPGFDQLSMDPNSLAAILLLNLTKLPWSINQSNSIETIIINQKSHVGFDAILKALPFDVDQDLNAIQKAERNAIKAMIDYYLYDALLYNWWIETGNFVKATNPHLRKNLSFLSGMFTFHLRDKVRHRLQKYQSENDCDNQKNSKSKQEIYENARKVYKCLSTKLRDSKSAFFFGDRPTSIDCLVYSHLVLQLYPSLKTPTLFSMLTFEFPDLIKWVNSDPVKQAFSNIELKRSKYEKPKLFDLWNNQVLCGNQDVGRKFIIDCLSVGLGVSFFGFFLHRCFKDV